MGAFSKVGHPRLKKRRLIGPRPAPDLQLIDASSNPTVSNPTIPQWGDGVPSSFRTLLVFSLWYMGTRWASLWSRKGRYDNVCGVCVCVRVCVCRVFVCRVQHMGCRDLVRMPHKMRDRRLPIPHQRMGWIFWELFCERWMWNNQKSGYFRIGKARHPAAAIRDIGRCRLRATETQPEIPC